MDIATLQAGIVSIIISLVVGLALLVIGYGVALLVEAVLRKAFAKARVEEKLKEKNLQDALLGFSFTGIITGIIKWIVFLWFLVSAVNEIESAFLVYKPGAEPVLTSFLVDFVHFLPAILQGIIILIVGFLIADYLAKKTEEGMKVQAKTVAAAVKIVVLYFTVTIALSNPAYGINIGIITTIFNYFVLAVAVGLGGGIAIGLGLGLKDSVARMAKKHEHGMEKAIVGKIKK